MRAAYAASTNPEDPLAGLRIGERPAPEPAPGWERVRVLAASLNHHDLWSLRGVGLPAERLPMILGTDAAGVSEQGNEVIVHSVIASPGWMGDETLDPQRTLLSELHQGTLAEFVTAPSVNLIPKPDWLSFQQAACLPTAWLTAYRMLTRDAGLEQRSTVLVQGATGGVASAAIALAAALGHRVWATSRTPAGREVACRRGAEAAFETGARLPDRVDAVIETVGQATWAHSLRALRPGGTIVVSGATSGPNPPAELSRVFFLQLRIVGSTMGTRAELEELLGLLHRTGLRPEIDHSLALDEVPAALRAMAEGRLNGKAVVNP